MSNQTLTLTDKRKESLISAVSIGLFFILIAIIYIINIQNNLWNTIVNFFNNFLLIQIPGTSISVPAPATPADFTVLYTAAFQFCLGLGALGIAILIIRVLYNSPLSRKAETIQNMVFWFGTSYLIITCLVNITIIRGWFVFWAGVIMIGGLSLVARAFVLMAKR